MRQDRVMGVDHEAQAAAAANWLRITEAKMAAIEGRQILAGIVGAAVSEGDAVTAVVNAFSCELVAADQILGLQVHRFAADSRVGLIEVRRQAATPPKVDRGDGQANTATPAGRRLVAFTTEPSSAVRRLSVYERAQRRQRFEPDRVEVLRAIVRGAQDPGLVLDIAYGSKDKDGVARALAAEFNWNAGQIVGVLECQVRVLSNWSKQSIEAELQGEL
jgi:hypothetical protein